MIVWRVMSKKMEYWNTGKLEEWTIKLICLNPLFRAEEL
jgi:hypothetical protein